MNLSEEHIKYINQSVLCWLATASAENMPNVSPKEIFAVYGMDRIIVANIASPQTIKNINENENVCISFIDILVQKGFQMKGKAKALRKSDPEFSNMEKSLVEMTGGKFPFTSIIAITIEQSKRIIAPKYILYPETTETEQVANARKVYNL